MTPASTDRWRARSRSKEAVARSDDLALRTSASLVDSTLAGARFPLAEVDFQMANREIRAKFAGPFEELSGTLFTERKELADTSLNGTADMAVALALPKSGPVELLEASGTTALTSSTLAGTAIDSAQVSGSFASQLADIKELTLTGPDVKASLAGTLRHRRDRRVATDL